MTDEEKNKKLLHEEDFIDCPKHKFSIKELIDKNPDGVDDSVIAKALNISVDEVEEIYKSAIEKLKRSLKT